MGQGGPVHPRKLYAVPMAGADQTRLTHQTGDPLAAVPLATPTQIGIDARRPLGLASNWHAPS